MRTLSITEFSFGDPVDDAVEDEDDFDAVFAVDGDEEDDEDVDACAVVGFKGGGRRRGEALLERRDC